MSKDDGGSTKASQKAISEVVIGKALRQYNGAVVGECHKLAEANLETRQFVLSSLLAAMTTLVMGLGRFGDQETSQALHTAAKMLSLDDNSVDSTSPRKDTVTGKVNWVD